MNSDPTPRVRARRKGARPAEILAAALDLFVEHGYAKTRAEDVAKRAGLSKGTLYLYFPNKESLFKAVITENIVPLIDEAGLQVVKHVGSSAELLEQLIYAWWERFGSTKLSGIGKLVLSEAGNFPELAKFYTQEVVDRWLAVLSTVIHRGIEQHEFRPVPIDLTVRALFAPLVMLMMWRHSIGPCCHQPIEPQAYIEVAVNLAIHGLTPRS